MTRAGANVVITAARNRAEIDQPAEAAKISGAGVVCPLLADAASEEDARTVVSEALREFVLRIVGDGDGDKKDGVIVERETQIASGYLHRFDPAAFVVGPTGLALDKVSSTGEKRDFRDPRRKPPNSPERGTQNRDEKRSSPSLFDHLRKIDITFVIVITSDGNG